MHIPALLLAIVAFWRLLRFDPQPQAELLREIEEWFFVPADTSPLVVVLLAGWLLYRRRESWLPLVGHASRPLVAAAALALSVAIHTWASAIGADDLQAFSLMMALLGIAALVAGGPGLRAAALPAVFLLFAVPFPGPLMNAVLYRFQIWTADYVGFVLNAFGLPALVAHDQILLAGDHFEVIEGCSGLRSVQTLTMVSVLLVDLFGRRGRHAAIIVAMAPFVAFALNGVRVITLILNPDSEIAAIHNLQGVAILLGGVLILYGVDGALERWLGRPQAAPAGGEARTALDGTGAGGAVRRFGPLAAMAALCVAALAVPGAARAPEARHAVERALAAAAVAPATQWKRLQAETDGAFLGTLGRQPYIDFFFEPVDADDTGDTKQRRQASVDRASPESVRLFVMRGDPADRLHSALSDKTRYPGSGWEIELRSEIEPGADAAWALGARSVEWMVMRSGTRRRLVYHWRDGAFGLAREIGRALTGLDALAASSPRRLAVVRVSTSLERGDEATREQAHARIQEFLAALEPRLRPVVAQPGPG